MTSWSLNGNHDMYSGGYGYFGTLLADPRFAAQHSADGTSTSFFRLTAPWLGVRRPGHLLGPGRAVKGASAVLQDPQAEYVAKVAGASERKLVLLSHHQLAPVYDQARLGPVLTAKLGPVLTAAG